MYIYSEVFQLVVYVLKDAQPDPIVTVWFIPGCESEHADM